MTIVWNDDTRTAIGAVLHALFPLAVALGWVQLDIQQIGMIQTFISLLLVAAFRIFKQGQAAG